MAEGVTDPSTGRPGWLGWLLLGLITLALVVGGVSFLSDRTVTPSEERLDRVLGETEQFIGQDVDVTGTVADIIGPRAFTLNAPEVFGQDLLVISRESLQPIGEDEEALPFDEGDRVFVKGTVREFNLREMEEELGADIIDDRFAEFNGRPVIVAESVERNL